MGLEHFVTTALTMYLEDYENKFAVKALEESLTEDNLKNAISLDQLKTELGFKEKKEI